MKASTWQRAEKTVLYRDGREIVDSGTAGHKKQKIADRSLVTYGTIGPILKLAQDVFATPATLTWARWEQVAGRKTGGFYYAVPAQKSRYDAWGCCLPDGDGTNGFDLIAPFRGEISIDPAAGAVVRLKAIADLEVSSRFFGLTSLLSTAQSRLEARITCVR